MNAIKTKSQKAAEEITALLRARNPLLWIVTREEARVETFLFPAAGAAGYKPYTWDCAAGVAAMDGSAQRWGGTDIGETLGAIAASSGERRVIILRDLPAWLEGNLGIMTVRQVRNLARKLPTLARTDAQALIVISPSDKVPPELAQHATVIEWPMPDRYEIGTLLQAAVDGLPEYATGEDGKPDPSRPIRAAALTNGDREKAIEAAIGLSGEEVQATYAKSLVQWRKIDPVAVAAEKKRIVKGNGLDWFDPLPGGLAAVGGLENLKAWLVQRGNAYSKAARDYGLPAPNGVLLVGITGCGKTLSAKAIATAWGVPLIKFDTGAVKSMYVGASEGNLRRNIRTIETIGRCVVWWDEVEKAMAGAVQGAADGGVSADALGTMLTWMQERPPGAFIVATCNDVTKLPPELTRKGRFDELFFVDLPTDVEREAILAATIKTLEQPVTFSNLREVIVATAGFTGAEVAQVVKDGMQTAFNDGVRRLTVADMLAAAADVFPVAKQQEDKIKALRDWSRGRARPATKQTEQAGEQSRSRLVDVA